VAQHSTLIDRASEPYRSAGAFAYKFARGKLRGDPVFRELLERGLLLGRGHILDLGCGQGLLEAWLRAALLCYESGSWPQGWPPAPKPRSTRGIELMLRDVQRARVALGSECEISQGDIRSVEFGTTDAVVILDVLHYIGREEQLQVLRRVRTALPPRGLLLLRIGDADGGLRFRYSQWVDRLVMLFRGHATVTTHCRSASQWHELLRQCGFDVEAAPMSHGTRFANVLMIAHAQ
jgi:cyclopropane fatty-acyl-phospholipid synthase-like methyltransferase